MRTDCRLRIVILAEVPLWTLPGLERFDQEGHPLRWLEALIPEFAKAEEFDIHWVTFRKTIRAPVVHQAFGQTFHILPRWKKVASMASGYAFEILRVRRLLRALEPDCVHAWGSEDVYGLAGAFSGYSRRIFSMQGCLNEVREHGGGLLLRIQALYEKLAVSRYSEGTAETPRARQQLMQLSSEMNVVIVDYGVTPDLFTTPWKPASSPRVLFVGSLSEWKGIRTLVEVAKRPEFSQVQFRIGGDGLLRDELRAIASENVTWLGRLKRDEVASEMAQAWVLAAPTWSDTGPTVLKEARVIGLPVVTTEAAGAKVYIDDQSGSVIPPGDPDTLAAALARIVESRETCVQSGRHRHAEMRARLHPATTAAAFGRLYRRLAIA